ncbi:MAG TPA: secretin N-terminal domain-containing protein, partial [Burkholderiales bacterium]|nr:secretin N-terminal domain-containing protein [Burkholderiales bacterium]
MTKILCALVAALVLLGCAANDTMHEGQQMIQAGNTEEGLARLEEAYRKDPNDGEIRAAYLRNRQAAVERFLMQGDAQRNVGAWDQAEAAYGKALRFEPDNARAKAGVAAVALDKKSQTMLAEAEAALKAGDEKLALEKARAVLADNPSHRGAKSLIRKVEQKEVRAESMSPKLQAALKKPITIELRDAPVRNVFELISQRSGMNFVYDKDIPADARATVHVRDTSIEDVMKFVMVTNQLDQRVLNENTLLIYPNTPQKNTAYKELVMKSFFLANADVKQTANMVRSLVKTRDIFVDEKLNLLVVRDTPEAIRAVEKLLASHDIGDPEVMLEVEVLEVGYNTLTNLGIQWPGSAALSVIGAAGVPGQITGTEAKNFSSANTRLSFSDPLLALNLRQQAGRTNVLANPRIRVKSKEKARIHIGDKVPVITTTAGATGFVSESVNYLDVGLKLEVEPVVNLDDDVGIKVGLEVSNISGQSTTAAGTTSYTVGTRNAATTLRLHDGETQVLAGLINDEDRRAATQVPGLSKMPVLGRLFKSTDDNITKTEIVLLMTPRVVRNIERPSARIEHFVSGTDAEVGGA